MAGRTRARRTKALADPDRDLLRRVLQAWSASGGEGPMPGRLGPRVLDQFTGDTQRLADVATQQLPIDLARQWNWIKGMATPGEPPLFPVASVSMRREKNGATGLTIRVALFGDSPHDEIQFILHGWRFESAEPSSDTERPSPRPFPHAQPTLGWFRSVPCMSHPHPTREHAQTCDGEATWTEHVAQWRSLINEIQPGFPLRGHSLAGQALAVVVSLYGAIGAAKILADYDEQLRRAIEENQEFRGVLGLPAVASPE